MKYKVLQPIAYFGRREKGEVIDMSEVEGRNIGPDYLEPVVEEAPKEAKKSVKLTKKFLKDNPELAAKYAAEGYKEGDTVKVEEAPKEE